MPETWTARGKGRVFAAWRSRWQGALADRNRLLWAVRVRWLTIAGFTILSALAYEVGVLSQARPWLVVGAVSSLLNACNHLRLRRGSQVSAVSVAAIATDHLVTTWLVWVTGGWESPFLVIHGVAVVGTALLVDTFVAALSAVFLAVLWLAVALLVPGGWPAGELHPMLRETSPPLAPVLTRAAFHLYGLGLLVFVGGFLSNRLRRSEQELAARNERLQAALVSLGSAHERLQEAFRQLRLAEAQLVQSEKLRSLGLLVAGVAHELNNPLSFLSANVESLREYARRLLRLAELPPDGDPALADRRRQWDDLGIDAIVADLPGLLDDCEEGVLRARQIMEALQAFSTGERQSAQVPVDIVRGIESTLSLLASRVPREVRLERRLEPLPDVESLPGQIVQVVTNLVLNAVDAVRGRGGVVSVYTREVPGAEWVEVGVVDDGPGIPADILPRIFDPFFTTKPPGEGTGLGLSVSYGIVQRHGGTIDVATREGKGTDFRVRLPVRMELGPAAEGGRINPVSGAGSVVAAGPENLAIIPPAAGWQAVRRRPAPPEEVH